MSLLTRLFVRRTTIKRRAIRSKTTGGSLAFALLSMLVATVSRAQDDVSPLPGTQPLTWEGDLAAKMVEGADRFLLKKTEESVGKRARHWHRDFSSVEAYNKSVEPNRKRLAHILGVRDERVASIQLAGSDLPSLITSNLQGGIGVMGYMVAAFGDARSRGLAVRVFPDIRTRQPGSRVTFKGTIVAVPDADQTPEQLVGLSPGIDPEQQWPRRLAESGYDVYIPALVDRATSPRNGRAALTNREFLHRSAYELGRTLAGYEVQSLLALIDSIRRLKGENEKIALVGYGEGGLLALYTAALDTRVQSVVISGAFDPRLSTWKEPVDRNVFGLLDEFGGAELASLVAPRTLIIDASRWPHVEIPPGVGGAPGELRSPSFEIISAEVGRLRELTKGLADSNWLKVVGSGDGPPCLVETLQLLLASLGDENVLPALGPAPKVAEGFKPQLSSPEEQAAVRERQLVYEFNRHNQQLLVESPYVRAEFMKKLDTTSRETFEKSAEEYRRIFYDDVIGRFDDEMLPANPRSRMIYETDKVTGYEVVLDVWPDVFAYGILVLPKDLKDGERRPVVVCQHGLEGRPQDVADPKVDNPAYNQYALRLAERGFITFAPQNLYIGHDKFRTLQRKANPLGKTLFSIIVPQHQQITDWLKTLPFVDGERIAFYGLSYGGKSAMRIPPLVKNYCLSICSADFNEWVWKNASTRGPYSYVWTGEYEIFEWDLGSTFNYAEMAALIAPRPFMVERGHFDGVAPDETVAYEFAKVRFLYEARLKLPPEDCQIEWFVGPHTIHGVGTFKFLHHHLNWPIRDDQPIVPLNK